RRGFLLRIFRVDRLQQVGELLVIRTGTFYGALEPLSEFSIHQSPGLASSIPEPPCPGSGRTHTLHRPAPCRRARPAPTTTCQRVRSPLAPPAAASTRGLPATCTQH